MIQLENVSKSFKEVHAVSNVSLEIPKGQICGFVGPNGAGKSTTLKVLLNFIFPDEGSAKILDFDVVGESKEIKKHVGYVPSETRLYPSLSSLDMLHLTMQFHGIDDEEEAQRLISIFNIEPHKKISTLSLGNKKKVSIVCALIHNPSVLILDEPTSGLDPLIQEVLFSELKRRAALGSTIFVSSHNLKEIQDHCDRVIFIKDGKLIDDVDLKAMSLTGKFVRIKGKDLSILKAHAKQVLKETESSLSFITDLSSNDLLNVLKSIDISDIIIEDVSIEHQFLEYYKEGGSTYENTSI